MSVFAAEAVIVEDWLAGTVGQEPPLDKAQSGSTDRPVIKHEKTSVNGNPAIHSNGVIVVI